MNESSAQASSVIIVGFPTGSVVQEMIFHLNTYAKKTVSVIDPDEFVKGKSPPDVPHMVGITLEMELRKKIIEVLDQGKYKTYSFVHDSVIRGTKVVIGEGSFISPFVTLGSECIIGRHCLVAPYAMVSHRSMLGTGCIMQPYSLVAGSSMVGEFCKLNVKSSVLDHIVLGDDIELGAGAMVTKCFTQPGRYLGSPARKKS